MLDRGGGDGGPTWCLVAYVVEGGFHDMWFFCLLFGYFVGFVITMDISVGSNFSNGDVMCGSFDDIYDSCYWHFVWVSGVVE